MIIRGGPMLEMSNTATRAGQAGAEQVGEVQLADPVGAPAEQRGDHHADRRRTTANSARQIDEQPGRGC